LFPPLSRRHNSPGLAELWGGWPIEPEPNQEDMILQHLRLLPILSGAVSFSSPWSGVRRIVRASTWQPSSIGPLRNFQMSMSEDDDGDGEESAPLVDDRDWREFRARLVLGNQAGDSPTASSSASWAYDSGGVIEPGSISKSND